MKGVYDLIGKANKTIDGIDRIAKALVQAADTQRKRCAVGARRKPTDSQANIVI